MEKFILKRKIKMKTIQKQQDGFILSLQKIPEGAKKREHSLVEGEGHHVHEPSIQRILMVLNMMIKLIKRF